jgi:hypothetical protein
MSAKGGSTKPGQERFLTETGKPKLTSNGSSRQRMKPDGLASFDQVVRTIVTFLCLTPKDFLPNCQPADDQARAINCLT